jgi:hypothetical protein
VKKLNGFTIFHEPKKHLTEFMSIIFMGHDKKKTPKGGGKYEEINN